MSIIQTLMGSIVSSGSGGGGGGGGFNGSPSPGGGSYNSSWIGSEGWSAQGTPFDPGNGISSVPNWTWGWRRVTYPGIWSNSGSNDNPSLFSGSETDASYDAYGGFGETSQSENYAMEWKGYIKAPTTDVYNFLLDSDDVAMFWIGSAALNPDSNSPLCSTNNSNQLNQNSVSLTADTWYPIRMRFQEWSGAERCQIYMGPAGSANPLYPMAHWHVNYTALGWNTGTNGY